MKKCIAFLLFFSVIFWGNSTLLAKSDEKSLAPEGGEITLDFYNVELQQALLQLAQRGKFNLLVSQRVRGRVSLHFSHVTPREALLALMNIYGLESVEVQKGIYFIRLQKGKSSGDLKKRRPAEEESPEKIKRLVEGMMKKVAATKKKRTFALEAEVSEKVNRLLRQGSSHLAEILLPYLDSDHRLQRILAIETLGKLGQADVKYEGKDVVEWLLARLDDIQVGENLWEAEALIWALGRLRDKRAVKAVMEVRKEGGSNLYRRTRVPFSWLPGAEKEVDKEFSLWLKKGKEALEEKDYKTALRHFSQVLKLHPQEIEAYLGQARAYLKMNKISQALASLKRAEKLDSQNGLIFFYRGIAWALQKKYKRAIENFNRALQLKPSHVKSYYNRGLIYSRKRQYKKAISDFTNCIKYDSDHYKAYFYRGRIYHRTRKYRRALRDYTKAIEANPNYYLAFNNRAVVYAALKKYRQALKDCNRAVALNPKSAKAFFNRGFMKRALGKYSSAISDFSRSIELNPKYSSPYMYRGYAYVKLGKKKKAVRDFQKFLKLAPNHRYAKRIQSLIYKLQGKKFH